MSGPLRPFLVDTAATILFFTVVAGFGELVVAGMALRDVALTRALTVPVMVLTARPYGLWRDRAMALAARRAVPATLADVAAFVSFQVPVYALTLAVVGADGGEIAAAIGAAIVFMVLLSRPFGLYLTAVRRAAG